MLIRNSMVSTEVIGNVGVMKKVNRLEYGGKGITKQENIC
jgi:hypothetical protein